MATGYARERFSNCDRPIVSLSPGAHVLLQVDRASAMVEKLCTPSDDEHNEHKRLQLRELAALNGTLKDVSACFVCGDEGHDAEHCPKKVRASTTQPARFWHKCLAGSLACNAGCRLQAALLPATDVRTAMHAAASTLL